MKLLSRIRQKLFKDTGQALVEAALIIALVGGAAVAGLTLAGDKVEGSLSNTLRKITDAGGISISDAVISDIPEQMFTAPVTKPEFTVTLDGKELVEGTNYTVKIINGDKAGKATLKITGIGEYTGSISKDYTITARVLNIPIQDGRLECAVEKVPIQGNFKEYDPDYMEIGGTYEAVDPGKMTAHFDLKYPNATTWSDGTTERKSVEWTLSKINLSKATANVSSSYYWQGSPVTPNPTVKYNGVTLKDGTDYVRKTSATDMPDGKTSLSCTVTITPADSTRMEGSLVKSYTLFRLGYRVELILEPYAEGSAVLTKYYGMDLFLNPSYKLRPEYKGYSPDIYNTKKDGTGTEYKNFTYYKNNAAITLYATFKDPNPYNHWVDVMNEVSSGCYVKAADAGDNSDWIAISAKYLNGEYYSLLMRRNPIKTAGFNVDTEFFAGSTNYFDQTAPMTEIGEWYSERGNTKTFYDSFCASLSANSGIRKAAVVPNLTSNTAKSVPTTTKAGSTTSSIMFPLTADEAEVFCAKIKRDGSTSKGSANYDLLFYSPTDIRPVIYATRTARYDEIWNYQRWVVEVEGGLSDQCHDGQLWECHALQGYPIFPAVWVRNSDITFSMY